MSHEAQGLVRRLNTAAPLKPILLAYANYADELGYCFAGVDCIAWDTGFDARTVERARAGLIAGGWLATKRRFATSAVTRLNLIKIEAAGEDRRPRTDVRVELEFTDVSAGRPQSRHTVGNVPDCVSPYPSVIRQLIPPPSFPPSSATADVTDSAAEEGPLPDPDPGSGGVGGEGLPGASGEVLEVVAGLEFGRHRRPTEAQAQHLGQLVDQAKRVHGLTLREVRRHAQAAINDARTNAVSYLSKAPPRGAPTSESARTDDQSQPAPQPQRPDPTDELDSGERMTAAEARALIRQTLTAPHSPSEALSGFEWRER